MMRDLPLAEPFAVQDIYFDGIRVERMRNGMIRFHLVRETHNGPEALPYALVTDISNAMQNICDAAKGIGMQFAGVVTVARPH